MEFRYRPPLWVKACCWGWGVLSAAGATLFLLLPTMLANIEYSTDDGGFVQPWGLASGVSLKWFGVGYIVFGIVAFLTTMRLRAVERKALVRADARKLVYVAYNGKERMARWAEVTSVRFVDASPGGRPNRMPRLKLGLTEGAMDLGWFLREGDTLARLIIEQAKLEPVGRNWLGEILYRRTCP